MTVELLIPEMKSCEQTKGQSVYQHGVDVFETFELLLDSLRYGKANGFRISNYLKENSKNLLSSLHDMEDCERYLLYHDCGKPRCRTVDDEGRVHFPNHAEVSGDTYLSAGGDEKVANLIRWDMAIHSLTADEIGELCKIWTVKDASTLLLAAIAEVHSNAKMFGGIESNSFKSKVKKIERRGKQICKHFFKETS